MLASGATHKNSCGTNGFTKIGDLSLNLGLIIGDLCLLLLKLVDGADDLGGCILRIAGAEHRGRNREQR